jgi:hypothetical protein
MLQLRVAIGKSDYGRSAKGFQTISSAPKNNWNPILF